MRCRATVTARQRTPERRRPRHGSAGHGLHYENVKPIAEIAEIVELNIGHAIVARAILDGFPSAVSEMKRLMTEARTA